MSKSTAKFRIVWSIVWCIIWSSAVWLAEVNSNDLATFAFSVLLSITIFDGISAYLKLNRYRNRTQERG